MTYKISVEEKSEVNRLISIEIPRDIYKQRFEKTLREVSGKAQIKGFRPGKVPKQMVDKLYGEKIHGDVMGDLVSNAYEEAVREHSLAVVGRPEFDLGDKSNDRKSEEDLKVVATVDVVPTPTIKDYLGAKVEVEVEEVNDEVFEKHLESFRKSHGSLDPVTDRTKTKAKDTISADFTGTIDGEPFPGSAGAGQYIELDTKAEKESGLVKGFFKEFKDKEVDEEFTFDFEYPKKYEIEEVAGKTAQFKATVKGIYTRTVPELDDALAKKTKMAETAEELVTKLRENLEDSTKRNNKQKKESAFFEAVAKKNKFDIPQAMIDQEIRAVLFRFGALDPNKQESYGVNVSQFRETLGGPATERVRNSIFLERIIEQEKFEVSDEELEAWLDSLAKEHKMSREDVDKSMGFPNQKDSLKKQAAREKMVERLLEKAEIKEKKVPAEIK